MPNKSRNNMDEVKRTEKPFRELVQPPLVTLGMHPVCWVDTTVRFLLLDIPLLTGILTPYPLAPLVILMFVTGQNIITRG